MHDAMWLADTITEQLRQRRRLCLLTVVDAPAGGPAAGTKLLYDAGGRPLPPTAAPPVAAALQTWLDELATRCLAERATLLAEGPGGLRAFAEHLAPPPALLIAGAGHIARALAPLGRELGFAVTVLDDRPDFADPAFFSGCAVLAEDFGPALRRLPLDAETYAVVVTRGHAHDEACAEELLRHELAYLGLIGSRRRIALVLAELQRRGAPAERVGRIFSPIGLPLGAEGPFEIALAIAAELLAVRRLGQAGARTLRERARPG